MNTAELCCKLNELFVMPHSDGSLRLSAPDFDDLDDDAEPKEKLYEHSGKGRMGYVEGKPAFIWEDGEAKAFFCHITGEWWPVD